MMSTGLWMICQVLKRYDFNYMAWDCRKKEELVEQSVTLKVNRTLTKAVLKISTFKEVLNIFFKFFSYK